MYGTMSNHKDEHKRHPFYLGDIEKLEAKNEYGIIKPYWFAAGKDSRKHNKENKDDEENKDDQNKGNESTKNDNIEQNQKLNLSVNLNNQGKRVIFFRTKIKQISKIDTVEQTFRLHFHVYLNWLMTKDEYDDYIEKRRIGNVNEFIPKWYPKLEFVNAVREIKKEWEKYLGGTFRVTTFANAFPTKYLQKQKNKKHNEFVEQKRDENGFRKCPGMFIRSKLQCVIEFAEKFELGNFPFDCQDLTVIMEERTRKAEFFPELRMKTEENNNDDLKCDMIDSDMSQFGQIDLYYSLINEWYFEGAQLRVDQEKQGHSGQKYPTIILKLKMRRRWIVEVSRICTVLFILSGLLLVIFSLNPVALIGDRLQIGVTFLLTYAAYIQIIVDSLPKVPEITFIEYYIAVGFLFCAFIMIQDSFASSPEFDYDNYDWFEISCIIFIVYNLFFIIWGILTSNCERQKLNTFDYYEDQQKNKTKNFNKCNGCSNTSNCGSCLKGCFTNIKNKICWKNEHENTYWYFDPLHYTQNNQILDFVAKNTTVSLIVKDTMVPLSNKYAQVNQSNDIRQVLIQK